MCRISLESLYARNAPPKFIRFLMCHLLKIILDQHRDISIEDGIYVFACGYLRGVDHESLVGYYRKMGFIEFALQGNINCNVYLSAPVKHIVNWCKSYI